MDRLTLVPRMDSEIRIVPLSWWFSLTTGREGCSRVIRRERRLHVREPQIEPTRA